MAAQARRTRRGGSSVRRSPDWGAYYLNSLVTAGALLTPPGMITYFVDWFKLPGGVLDPLTGDSEPVDDTLVKILAWGGNAFSADETTTGLTAIGIGIIEWHGNSDVPPPESAAGTEFPTPLTYPQAEWVYTSYSSGNTNVPGDPLVTNDAGSFNGWQRMGKAKRKLPENVGLLLVVEAINNTGFDIDFLPTWMYRSLFLAGDHSKPRR